MQTIPQIRARLLEIANELHKQKHPFATEIGELADATRRRPPIFRKETARCPLRGDAKDKRDEGIREYAREFPDATYLELSQALNCPTSTIAFALNGQRAEA